LRITWISVVFYPLSAFRFCTRNLALSNHRGDVSGALKWSKMADSLFDRAMKADINACADYLNNRFISLHNRYVFSPGFPENLKAILGCLEDRYRTQCAGGCVADRVLGELYGSIVQNFGFCGPKYLGDCEKYAELAMAAFGAEEVPELKDDMLRQYSYLVYTYLDAGQTGAARKALFRYLEIKSRYGFRKRLERKELSRWQHAVAARFFSDAEASKETDTYFHWGVENEKNIRDMGHPWQLWLYNMGRIAHKLNKLKEAKRLFSESLKLCLSEKSGPTVRVMALLPVACLRHIGHLPGKDFNKTYCIVKTAARGLNRKYFKILFEAEPETVLESVFNSPSTLFPFSYH